MNQWEISVQMQTDESLDVAFCFGVLCNLKIVCDLRHFYYLWGKNYLGPSTVTLMALFIVAIWTGDVDIIIVSEKLFPTREKKLS